MTHPRVGEMLAGVSAIAERATPEEVRQVIAELRDVRGIGERVLAAFIGGVATERTALAHEIVVELESTCLHEDPVLTEAVRHLELETAGA